MPKSGKAFIRHIHLPVHGNPVYGATLWQAIRIFFAQKVRQGWGGAEIGYEIQLWKQPSGAPFLYKAGRLLKLIHDHLFFSTAGFIVAIGTVLSIVMDHNPVITMPPVSFSPLLFNILNLLGGSALLVIWFTERVRLSRGRKDWNLKSLLSEVRILGNLPGVVLPVDEPAGASGPDTNGPGSTHSVQAHAQGVGFKNGRVIAGP